MRERSSRFESADLIRRQGFNSSWAQPQPFKLLLLTACALVALNSTNVAAQTSQNFSIQGSALVADIYGENFSAVALGYGVELQLRRTPSALSIGGGVQYTHHNDAKAERDGHKGNIKLIGIFLEPRYGIYVGSNSIAPYISARMGFARLDLRNDLSNGDVLTWISNGITLNGGGGLLVRLSTRANLDLGATAGFTRYSASTGHLNEDPFEVELGSGTNLVMRVGIAFGLGH